MNNDWLDIPAMTINENFRSKAQHRQSILTKPPGALGELENIAITLATLQMTERPAANNIHIVIFAGDHGVAEEGVSAFPQSVTVEMIRNFAAGGAAISVLARALNAPLEVINMGTVSDPGAIEGVMTTSQGAGTCNFVKTAAMTVEQLYRSLSVGRQSAERAKNNQSDIFIAGEMGIANTTSATAIACALLNIKPALITGPGTGLDQKSVAHKADVIARGLQQHDGHLSDPLEVLRRLGGFEIAALTGSYIASAQMGLPVVVDGYIASVAALLAVKLQKDVSNWLLFAHASAEPGHATIMQALNAKPVLNLGMRLGEGSGAAVAIPVLRLACTLHNDMSSFADANVSEKND